MLSQVFTNNIRTECRYISDTTIQHQHYTGLITPNHASVYCDIMQCHSLYVSNTVNKIPSYQYLFLSSLIPSRIFPIRLVFLYKILDHIRRFLDESTNNLDTGAHVFFCTRVVPYSFILLLFRLTGRKKYLIRF
jgi:hypothetical protein